MDEREAKRQTQLHVLPLVMVSETYVMQLRELGESVELAPSDWWCIDFHRFGLEFKPQIWVVINITHYRILGGGLQINEETM